MTDSDSEKAAKKFLSFFNVADLDTHKLDRVAFWVKYLASVPVMAKIIYFAERLLSPDDFHDDDPTIPL
jgi:hypothetical protein